MRIYYYRESDGQIPVKHFLEGLSAKLRGRFFAYLTHLKENEGKIEGIPFRKLHGYPLEEVRVKESKKLHRVIIKIRLKNSILLLHGFTKREGEATPKKEIEIAYKRYLTHTEQTTHSHETKR
ncbi:MAG: type II toxin-antitoxin system RelE/ParE family toxin [Magnetococcales bacterium]|nr:type II toxin-antitoxin system RelE/ParE family toxin [Magnetococcales bacterium]